MLPRVYQPKKRGRDNSSTLFGGLLVLGAFVLLPLTQLITDKMDYQQEREPDTASLEPPPPPEMEEPPAPEEQEEEEPPPQLENEVQQFTLDQMDLDLSAGTGGVFGNFSAAAEAGENLSDLSVFDVSDLDRKPMLVASVDPKYPQALKKSKVEGSVVIVFVVNEQGRVSDPRVQSSSRTEFESPAMDALKRWRFQPGTKSGKPVKTYMRLPMAFRMGKT